MTFIVGLAITIGIVCVITFVIEPRVNIWRDLEKKYGAPKVFFTGYILSWLLGLAIDVVWGKVVSDTIRNYLFNPIIISYIVTSNLYDKKWALK